MNGRRNIFTLNNARSLLPERVTAPVRHLFPAVENFAHLPASLSDLQPGTFVLFWTTSILIALIVAELCIYDVNITALSETHLADEGFLSEAGGEYTFFS